MKRLLIVLLVLALFGCASNKLDESGKVISFKKSLNNNLDSLTEEVNDTEISDDIDEDDKDAETPPSSNNGSSNGSGNQNNPQPEPNPSPQPSPSPDPKPTPQPSPEPQPKPEPPKQVCPNGKYPDKPCDYIADNNYYHATFSSESSANAEGNRMMNEVEYYNGKEITNYSVQAVTRNDGSVAYYGLNLWSNKELIK